jgi:PST family polysaccharide transporter
MLDTPVSNRHHRLFETEHLRRDLRRRSVRGAIITLTGQACRLTIQLAGVAVLARLLLPADFGLFGKTIALTGFITVIQTGGLSLATVQRAEITHEQISLLFWLNAALGVAAAGLIAAISPAMAWFYDDPRVLWLGLAMAGTVAISGLTVQHDALMQRQMRFTAITFIYIVAAIAGFTAAIVSAWGGAGYWALAIQQYASSLTILLLLLTFCRWLPGLPRRGAGVRPMVKIGANQTGFNILNFVARNFDSVLIGRFVSDAAVGFYTLAYRLLLLPIHQINGPVSAVVIPALSRLHDQPQRYARFYYQAIGAIVFVGMPVVGFLFVDARAVILLVVGPKWLPAVPIFQAFGIAALVGTFNVAGGWVYTSLGRTDRLLRWQLFSTPVTVGGFFLGLPWGAVGVAASFSATRLLLTVPSLTYCFQGTPIRVSVTLLTLARPAFAAVAAGTVLWTVQSTVGHWPHQWVGFDLVIYGVIYFAAWLAVPGGSAQLRQLFSILDELRPRKTEITNIASQVD